MTIFSLSDCSFGVFVSILRFSSVGSQIRGHVKPNQLCMKSTVCTTKIHADSPQFKILEFVVESRDEARSGDKWREVQLVREDDDHLPSTF